jgi:hypothetical protein
MMGMEDALRFRGQWQGASVTGIYTPSEIPLIILEIEK